MIVQKSLKRAGLSLAMLLSLSLSLNLNAATIELTTNGAIETGDFTGWTQFPTAGGQQLIDLTSSSPFTGSYPLLSTQSLEINNVTLGGNSLVKQANMMNANLTTSQTVTINFDARGEFAVDGNGAPLGGLAFAEFFSELTGGGTSKAEILGLAPLAVNADPNVWTHFSFTTTTDDTDVSGGVTLQLGATTGGAPGSASHMWYDNVSVTVEGTAIPNANFNGDSDIDGADFLIWQRGFDSVGQVDNSNGDADFNGTVAAADLSIWQTQFGDPPPTSAISAVPEPASILLIGLGVVVVASCRRRVG